MKPRNEQPESGYPNQVGFDNVWNDGEVAWALAFFDNGDLTMGFLGRQLDAIGPVAPPEYFRKEFPTDPAFHNVPLSAEAVRWIQAEIDKAMSRQGARAGRWTRTELEAVRHTLTLTIDEKRKADRSFFGGKPWPEKRAAQGPEATVRADKACRMAEDIRRLTQKYGNAAMMTFYRNKRLVVLGEEDHYMAAPLQQALETLLNDGWRPVGTLVFECTGETAQGETPAIHMEPCEGSGMEPQVQLAALRTASQALLQRLGEEPDPLWFRTQKPAANSQPEAGEKFVPPQPHLLN